MKRFKKCMYLLLLILCVSLVDRSQAVEVKAEASSDWMYRILAGGSVEISGYSGTDTCVTIPVTIDNRKVTSIGDDVFSGCDSLTSITIPSGVTSIGMFAFFSCDSLTNVTIPDGLTSIGYYAFFACDKLTSIAIPESVTSIDKWAFSNSVVLSVVQGSYAETYAKENGYKYIYIGGGVPTTETSKTEEPTTEASKEEQNVTIPKVSKVTKFKATAKKKGLTLTWKKVSGVNGYKIQVSTKKNFKDAKTYTASKSKKKYTISKLKAKKKYYVRICAYKTYKDSDGKTQKVYGKYVTINKKTK